MRKTVILASALLLGSCGIADKFRKSEAEKALEPNQLTTIDEQVSFDTAWRYSIGGGNENTHLRPALGSSSVFVANDKGDVASVDLETGKSAWRTDVDMRISGGVGIGEGLVFVAGYDGRVVALDQRDGSEVWAVNVTSEVLAPPSADRGIVVVKSIDGAVVGLETTNGQQAWKIVRDVPSLTLRGDSAPLLRDGVAIIGFSDGRLAAVNISSGVLLWNIPVARPSGTNEVERMIDIDGSPLLLGETLYAASYQGDISALSFGENQVNWNRDVSTHVALAADSRNIYVSTAIGEVHAYERETGTLVWAQDTLLRRKLSGPAQSGAYVFVGDYQGYLHAISKTDGSLAGRVDAGPRISTQPLVSDNRIIVYTGGSGLRAYTVSSEP